MGFRLSFPSYWSSRICSDFSGGTVSTFPLSSWLRQSSWSHVSLFSYTTGWSWRTRLRMDLRASHRRIRIIIRSSWDLTVSLSGMHQMEFHQHSSPGTCWELHRFILARRWARKLTSLFNHSGTGISSPITSWLSFVWLRSSVSWLRSSKKSHSSYCSLVQLQVESR